VAVLAGLFLAVQVTNDRMDVKGVLVGAVLAFIPVALLAGTGIYLYVKSAPEEVETVSFTRKQRELIDLLRSQGKITIPDAAHELEVPVEQIHEMVDDLLQLQIFPGHVDWEEGVLYMTDMGALLDAPSHDH
jgi:hypothetical protein